MHNILLYTKLSINVNKIKQKFMYEYCNWFYKWRYIIWEFYNLTFSKKMLEGYLWCYTLFLMEVFRENEQKILFHFYYAGIKIHTW